MHEQDHAPITGLHHVADGVVHGSVGEDWSPAEYAGHGADGGHGHDKHAGHDPEMFRRRFWLSLALTIPLVVTSEMVMDWFGYELDFPGMSWVGPVLGSFVFLWGGWPFLAGRRRRGPRPPAGDDAADLDGDHRRLRGVDGDQPRLVRPGVLVGAGRAGHDHAARPLAGDEGDRPGPRRARRAGRAAARRRRDRRRRRRPTRCRSTSCRSATSCWCAPAAGCRPTARSSTARPSSTSR